MVAGVVCSQGGSGLVSFDPQDRVVAVLSERVVRVEEQPDTWVRAYDIEGNWAGAPESLHDTYQMMAYTLGPNGPDNAVWVREAILEAARTQCVPVYGVEGLW